MNFIHSGGFRLHSCRNAVIPVDSCGFRSHSCGFLWIPVDSTGISSFLQECKGHEEVVLSTVVMPAVLSTAVIISLM